MTRSATEGNVKGRLQGALWVWQPEGPDDPQAWQGPCQISVK